MKLIVGLGNPGKEYQSTRHNVGFMVLDELADQLGVIFKLNKKLKSELVKTKDRLLVKPQTYMNLSGEAVGAVTHYYEVKVESDLVLVHDDLDLKLGSFKLTFAKGPKEHNGVLSVKKHLGTDRFWRLRVGVDNRPAGWSQTGTDYVLSPFTKDELNVLNQVIQKAVERILDFKS